jgi:hypothetical protein
MIIIIGKKPNFKVGDQVWLQRQHIKTTRPLKKLNHQRLCPFLIVKQINVMAFQLKVLGSMKIYCVFHVSLLEPYHASTIPKRIHDSLPPIEVDGEHEYEVEDILDSKIFNSQLQYFVHWHGYDVSKCSWEPIKNLLNAMEKVHEFHQ